MRDGQCQYTENVVKFGRAIPEICMWTGRQTDRQTDMLITALCSPTGPQ